MCTSAVDRPMITVGVNGLKRNLLCGSRSSLKALGGASGASARIPTWFRSDTGTEKTRGCPQLLV